jgi:hypothetical protein
MPCSKRHLVVAHLLDVTHERPTPTKKRRMYSTTTESAEAVMVLDVAEKAEDATREPIMKGADQRRELVIRVDARQRVDAQSVLRIGAREHTAAPIGTSFIPGLEIPLKDLGHLGRARLL